MGVTRKRKKSKKTRRTAKLARVTGLDDLANFLNYNFDQHPDNWRRPDHPLFWLYLNPTQPDLSEVKKLQKEICEDLKPLIAPEYLGDLDICINGLIETINGLNIVNMWDELPFDHAWLSRHGGLRWSDMPTPPAPVRPIDRVVRIAGYKWLLRKTPVASSVRAKVFQIVMEALETDTFLNLRKCKECPRFFVAADPREEVCGLPCQRKRDREQAKLRQRHLRRNDELETEKEGLRNLQQIWDFVHGKPNSRLEDLVEAVPFLRHLDRPDTFLTDLMKKPPNFEKILNTLSPGLRKRLANGP